MKHSFTRKLGMVVLFSAVAVFTLFLMVSVVIFLAVVGVPSVVRVVIYVSLILITVWLVVRFWKSRNGAAGLFSESLFSDRSTGKGGIL